MLKFTCHMPTRVFFGKGQIKHLGDEVKKYGKNVLLVYGGGSIKRIGLYDEIMKQLKNARVKVFELGGVKPNPRLSTVHKGADLCRKEGIDFILAAGGGSTIDCSKAIAAQVKYDGDVWDYFINRTVTVQNALPLGTVLTLAATGSEMNGNTVITNLDTRDKLSLSSPFLLPRFSILDPVYTFSLPVEQTRNGIVDIMVHVIDQYFDRTSGTPLQDMFSESILKIVIENSPIVLKTPDNYDARANIMWCGTWALNGVIGYGKKQDWAVHEMEHEVSAIYDIAHAVGLAIISPNWAEYVLSEDPGKFVQFAERVWDVQRGGKNDKEVALEGVKRYREFFKNTGMPLDFKEIGVDDSNFKIMAEKAVRFGSIGGYKKLNAGDVEKIFNMCLES